MRFSLLLLLMSLLSAINILGQENDKKLNFSVEAGHLSGIGNVRHTEDIYHENFMKGSRLRFVLGYELNDYFSTGLGFGLDGYKSNYSFSEPYYNTAPLFIEFNGKLRKSGNTPDASIKFGNSIKFSESFESGLHFSFDVGYSIKWNKIKIRPSLGYNIQQIRNANIEIYDESNNNLSSYDSNILLKSLSFNLRFTF
ncbi:hypothetical protein [Mangrovivirga cuniculi]|uniref:Outer membrane protein beta-barrel domain-containing protein n=1 Tax=Mangrovivirga cuniculi TaxID=2715131 RepID=A0A4D7JFW3_9BACT|nr:hypothetical protein [Mangrovivirga cuniculi]QCK13557.1 hypothetical protein DCC35_01705 [Mangrovivirga cuniculi]